MKFNDRIASIYTVKNSNKIVVYTRWISTSLVALALSGALMACGDSSPAADGSGDDSIVSKWASYCESAAAEYENSCSDQVDTGLTTSCKMVGVGLHDTDECRAQVDALTACNAERTWQCAESGGAPGVLEPDPCSAEEEPFVLPTGSCVNEAILTVETETD